MYFIRPIAKSDHKAFVDLAFEAGLGIVSLPKNPKKLLEMIEHSEESFAKTIKTPGDELYLFVLQNYTDRSLGGVCGIRAKTGITSPLLFFRIDKQSYNNPLLEQAVDVSTLKLVHYQDAPTEICSLFLAHASRHSGLGRLLSLSRFLFIADFLERFDQMVFADMRGVIENNRDCPFWDGIGRHFTNMDFASFMQAKQTKEISTEALFPKTAIFIPLLPQAVQQTIDNVHLNTKPALNMLMQEGFTLSDDISVYDGGPKIEAETKEILTIKQSLVANIKSINAPEEESTDYLLSNGQIQFRCCYGNIQIDEETQASISASTAAALNLKEGDKIRYIPHLRFHT